MAGWLVGFMAYQPLLGYLMQNQSFFSAIIWVQVTGIQTDPLISARQSDLIIINKKERTCKIVDFAVLADHWVKLKECKKWDKYLDLVRELKKLWIMKVAVILIVSCAFVIVTKRLIQGLEGLEIRGLQHCWDRPECWEESWRYEESCCHSNSSGKLSASLMWKALK